MPYKRDRSPYYYARRRNLPGYGDTGRLSTRTTSKKVASDMERLLDQIAERALTNPTWYELLNAVCKEKTIGLPELLRAKNAGTLEALKRSLTDPPLTEAVRAFQDATSPKRPVLQGLAMLKAYAPPTARLGDLTARTIMDLCLDAERNGNNGEGIKRNSVRRTLLRAISLLLRYHLGKAERDRIFADVHYAGEDDTREIHLTPQEIGKLLTACTKFGYDELATIIRLAMQASADRGVLLRGDSPNGFRRGLLVRDLRILEDNKTGEYSGEAYLADGKTKDRTRTVPLTDSLCRELLVLCRDKGPDEPVFNIAYQQLDFVWTRVREEAGLDHVRFKDLRAQFSIYGEEADIPLTVLAKTMGHGDEAMTRRYQQRRATLSLEQALAIEQAMLPPKKGGAKQAEQVRKTA